MSGLQLSTNKLSISENISLLTSVRRRERKLEVFPKTFLIVDHEATKVHRTGATADRSTKSLDGVRRVVDLLENVTPIPGL